MQLLKSLGDKLSFGSQFEDENTWINLNFKF